MLRCPFFRRFLGIKCEYTGYTVLTRGLAKGITECAASECLCTRAHARDDEATAKLR